MKEIEQIAKELTQTYSLNENEDIIEQTIREKLKEIPDNAPLYLCPSCKTTITNNVFKLQEGLCPTCGENVEPIYESSEFNLYDEKRYTCPHCKTTKLYKLNESSCCNVCNRNMDVYVPYSK